MNNESCGVGDRYNEQTTFLAAQNEQAKLEVEDEQRALREEKEAERNEELREQIKKNTHVVTKGIVLLMTMGTLMVLLSAFAFYFVCTESIENVISSNSAMFLSSYRSILIGLCAMLMMNTAYPSSNTIPMNYMYPYGHSPLWHDLSHMSNNQTLQQELMNQTITFFALLQQKVNSGGCALSGGVATGDDLIDSLDTIRTLVPGSALSGLMMDTVECIPNMVSSECEEKGRIFGLTPPFAGLDGLITSFAMSAQSFAGADNVSLLWLNDTRLQMVNTEMQYDLKGGIKKYGEILTEEQSSTIRTYNVLLIVLFIIHFLLLIGSYTFCFLPSRNHLFRVAEATTKIVDFDPTNDQSFDAFMWKEVYSVDIQVIDSGHQVVCQCGLELVRALDEEEPEKIGQKLELFVKAFFGTLSEEEELMHRYKHPACHTKQHYAEHIAIAKQLVKLCLAVEAGKDVAAELVEVVSSWFGEHVQKTDRGMVAFLVGKAPTSVLEKQAPDRLERPLAIPPSLSAHMKSDDVSIQDSRLYAAFVKKFRKSGKEGKEGKDGREKKGRDRERDRERERERENERMRQRANR